MTVPLLHVGLVAEREETHGAPGARHAAAGVRAVDPREAHVVVHQELPRGRAVLGPGAHEPALVVAVRAVAVAIDDRPVGEVGEQELDVVVELCGILDDVDRDAPLGIALAAHVALLHGIAGAERHERAAVQHSAADVEGGLDDEHVGAEIARTNRRREPGATGADYEDVAFVVPADLAGARGILRFGTLWAEQRRRSEPDRAARDDVSPRDAGFVGGGAWTGGLFDCSLRHVPPG